QGGAEPRQAARTTLRRGPGGRRGLVRGGGRNDQEDRMVITADQAREIATEQERSDRRTLNEKVERETLALTTTWLGRRRLRYVERAIWRAARRGERETLVGGWSYARAHGVAHYLR